MSSSIPSSATTQIFQSDCICIGRVQFEKRKKLVYNKKSSSVIQDDKNSANKETINAVVYAIRLNRIIKDTEANAKNRELIRKYLYLDRINDLIHSIVALYDNSLPDIGIQYIYDCICARKAYTICIFREIDWDLLESNENSNHIEAEYDEDKDCLESIENEEPKSVFHELFHKTSRSESENEDEDEDEDDDDDGKKKDDDNFTLGVKTFIEKFKKSNENNTNNLKNPLSRLLACATIERVNTFQYPGQDEWVVLLQLMAVLKPYRGFGIGKYMMNNIIQNPQLVDHFDAIITSADQEAIEFYEKFGFNDNAILNSKYKAIGDIWTNTTKMCYIPPYMAKTNDKLKTTSELNSIEELTQIENDYKKWNKIALTSYQINSQIFIKLKQEIISLKAKQCAQENIINDLQIRNQILERKNRLLNIQLKNLKKGSNSGSFDDADVDVDEEIKSGELVNESKTQTTKETANDDDNDIDKLINELKLITSNDTKFGVKGEDRIIKRFKNSLKKSELKNNIEIKSVKLNKNLNKNYKADFESLKNSFFNELNDNNTTSPALISELYITKLNVPNETKFDEFYENILSNGFSQSHCVQSKFGGLSGIHLSRYANVTKSHDYVLFVEAIISNCFSVIKDGIDFDEKTLKDYQSLLILDNDCDNLKENEYFIMDYKYILPLAAIEYELSND